jgi:hypothetical protein
MMVRVDHDPIRSSAAGTALVGVADGDWGRIVRADQTLADLLGTSLDALVGTRLVDHVVLADRVNVLDVLSELTAGGQYEGEWRMAGAGSAPRAIRIYASPVAMRSGRAIVIRFGARV